MIEQNWDAIDDNAPVLREGKIRDRCLQIIDEGLKPGSKTTTELLMVAAACLQAINTGHK